MDFKSENRESRLISRKFTIKSKTQDNTADRRLKNWKRWLKNREKTCQRLKSLTGRKSEDLLLNSYEKIRPKIAIQNLLEAASLELLSEESQKNLNFWATPEFLRNKKCPDIPELAASINKKLLKHPPDVSQVFLPEISQREKRLTIPADLPLTEKRNDYLLRKLEQMESQLSKLNLRVQGIDQVAVVGLKVPEKEKVIMRIEGEDIIFEKDEDENTETKSDLSIRNSFKFHNNKKNRKNRTIENGNFEKINNKNRILLEKSLKTQNNIKKELIDNKDINSSRRLLTNENLQKNNREINCPKKPSKNTSYEKKSGRSISVHNFPEESSKNHNNLLKSSSTPLTFSLNFHSPQKTLASRQSICLVNQTFTKIIYEWQEILSDFQELEKISTPRSFRFEKPSGLILPGQCEDLSIIYHPTSPGASLESIRLDTEPRITESSMIFHLWGVCDEPTGLRDKLLSYDDYIHVKLRNSIIQEIIEAIWMRIESDPPEMPCYVHNFLESDVFNARNPNFHYNHEIVKKIKKIYVEKVYKDAWAPNLREVRAHLLNVNDVRDFIELTQKLEKPQKQKLTGYSKHNFVYSLLSSFSVEFSDLSESTKWHLTQQHHYKFKCLQDDRSRSEEFESSGSEGLAVRGDFVEDEFYGEYGGQLVDIYDRELYFDVFYVRAWDLLGDTIDKISAALLAIDWLRCDDEKFF
uniref:Uncharacterized protein n=1 Tax=Bracon brevicornis TaxID=1563983 RepID=A0A6V7HRM1_9HYME